MIASIFSEIEFSYWYIIYAVILFLLFIGLTYILSILRKKTLAELHDLLYVKLSFKEYYLLLSNWKLRIIFTKSQLLLLRLEGSMIAGNDRITYSLIHQLDEKRLLPYQKLDFYQKRLTYFVEKQQIDEAKRSLENIQSLLGKNTHEDAKKIVEEANTIYGVYIDHDKKYIQKLNKKAESTTNLIVQGICYFRMAKLFFFESQSKKVDEYLYLAQANLKGTYYEQIIQEALMNHTVLQYK